MSNLRHGFRIVLDGTKYEIVTSARDLAAIDTADDANEAMQTLRLLHAACVRLHIDVPPTWEEFADVLDDMTDLEPDEPLSEPPNPIQTAVSDG